MATGNTENLTLNESVSQREIVAQDNTYTVIPQTAAADGAVVEGMNLVWINWWQSSIPSWESWGISRPVS